MTKATREKVIKWFMRKFDGHKVPLGYNIEADAAKIYGISLKESHECKLASFKRHLGMGRFK